MYVTELTSQHSGTFNIFMYIFMTYTRVKFNWRPLIFISDVTYMKIPFI